MDERFYIPESREMPGYPRLTLGMRAPDFTATTTNGILKLSDFRGKWVVLFSHPGDFTPVCTTEFIAFSKFYPYFVQKNAQLIGLSIDSNASHLAWLYNIYQTMGVRVPFPVIADRSGEIARMFGMVAESVSNTETVRNVFIIDPEGIIRCILMYPLTTGRYIPEILRILDSLQVVDREGVVTPANWMPYQPVIVPYPKTFDDLLERVNNPQNLQCAEWYLCYKTLPSQEGMQQIPPGAQM